MDDTILGLEYLWERSSRPLGIMLMWPFKKNKETVEKFDIRSDEAGGLSIEFTVEEKAWVDSDMSMFDGSGIHKDHYDEVVSAFMARSLSTYSASQEREAERTVDEATKKECLNKAIAAIMKAYNVYPLPIYMYALAQLWTLVRRGEMARHAYERFLKLQTQFSPNEIASSILAEWDVDDAVRRAMRILSEHRV